MVFDWTNATVVIVGGTGSLGRALARRLLTYPIQALRIVSRDEFKHAMFRQQFKDERVKTLIGDVRDAGRLRLAFYEADVVINAAAIKRIEMAAQDPIEAVRTNVGGTQAVIEASLDSGVSRVMGISTDKACRPVTLYGSTKACAEALLVAANIYAGHRRTRFSAARYGNVACSRGSLIPMLMEQRKTGQVSITHPNMSRFWMRMDEAVDFVLTSIEAMEGGEVWVPKLPSVWVRDVIEAVAPDCDMQVIGLRGVEKLHEDLLAFEESAGAIDLGDRYAIKTPTYMQEPYVSYDSGSNKRFLTVEEIRGALPLAMEEAA